MPRTCIPQLIWNSSLLSCNRIKTRSSRWTLVQYDFIRRKYIQTHKGWVANKAETKGLWHQPGEARDQQATRKAWERGQEGCSPQASEGPDPWPQLRWDNEGLLFSAAPRGSGSPRTLTQGRSLPPLSLAAELHGHESWWVEEAEAIELLCDLSQSLRSPRIRNSCL